MSPEKHAAMKATETTFDRMKRVVADHLGVDADTVVAEASFADDLGADSLDVAELAMEAEEEFEVEIPCDAAEAWATVGDAVRGIDRLRAEAGLG